jgi:hypothetical protein
MSLDANTDHNVEQFTQTVVLRIISKIGQSIFSKKYSDLVYDLAKPRNFTDDYNQLLNILELARGENRELGTSSKSGLGISWVAKAGVEDGRSTQVSVGKLTHSEILFLLEELVDFLKNKNIYKFVLFIDEGNKLALVSNAQIIRENLKLFSASGLQFCFVRTTEVINTVTESREVFLNKIEVGPFESRDSINTLITNYLATIDYKKDSNKIYFSENAIDTIWKLSKGSPYAVQLLCSQSFMKAIESNDSCIDTKHIIDVIADRFNVSQ